MPFLCVLYTYIIVCNLSGLGFSVASNRNKFWLIWANKPKQRNLFKELSKSLERQKGRICRLRCQGKCPVGTPQPQLLGTLYSLHCQPRWPRTLVQGLWKPLGTTDPPCLGGPGSPCSCLKAWAGFLDWLGLDYLPGDSLQRTLGKQELGIFVIYRGRHSASADRGVPKESRFSCQMVKKKDSYPQWFIHALVNGH